MLTVGCIDRKYKKVLTRLHGRPHGPLPFALALGIQGEVSQGCGSRHRCVEVRTWENPFIFQALPCFNVSFLNVIAVNRPEDGL